MKLRMISIFCIAVYLTIAASCTCPLMSKPDPEPKPNTYKNSKSASEK